MKPLDLLKGAAILIGAIVIIYFVAKLVITLLYILLPIAFVALVVWLIMKYWKKQTKKA